MSLTDPETGEVVDELPGWTAIDYILYILRRLFRTADGSLNGTFYICLYTLIGMVVLTALVYVVNLVFCGEKTQRRRHHGRGGRIAVKSGDKGD